MRFPVGVVDVVYAHRSIDEQVALAREDGYDHIDPMVGVDAAVIGFPVGCPTAFPKPVPGWCSTPAPPAGEGAWERAVRWFRAAPGALVEPWRGAVINSAETVRALQAEVPGLRVLVDTGHVADWGGDPLELLEHAGHVQLRQGAPGRTQVHVDDPAGTVDFAAVLARLEAIDYRGVLSVEYFDLPEQGWALDDPRQWARDLAARVRALGGRSSGRRRAGREGGGAQ